MIRKYIHHAATVGFKYFFDLDLHTMTHSLAIVIIAFGFLKLVGYWLAAEFQNGIKTIRYDYLTIREQIGQLNSKLEKYRDTPFLQYCRNLKDHLSPRNLSA